MRDEVGKNLALGIGAGFSDEMKTVTKEMQQAIPKKFDTGVANSNYGGYQNNQSYYYLVDAFKTALSQMTVEMDDEPMGKFVEKTITRAIYTSKEVLV